MKIIRRRDSGAKRTVNDRASDWPDSPVLRPLAEGTCVHAISRELSSDLSTKLRHVLNNFQLRKLIRVAICLIIWSTERYRRGKACGRQARTAGIRALAYEIHKSVQYARGTKAEAYSHARTIVTTCRLSLLSLSLCLSIRNKMISEITCYCRFPTISSAWKRY